ADGRREQLREGGRQRLAMLEGAQQVLAGGRMDALEQRNDLVPDQAAERVAIAGVFPPLEPTRPAEGFGLLAPDAEQRPNDAVLAADLDPLRVAARGEAVDDRLDLVGERVTGRAEPVCVERVAHVAQLRLGL